MYESAIAKITPIMPFFISFFLGTCSAISTSATDTPPLRPSTIGTSDSAVINNPFLFILITIYTLEMIMNMFSRDIIGQMSLHGCK